MDILELLDTIFQTSEKTNENDQIKKRKKEIEESYITLSAQVEEIMSILKKYSSNLNSFHSN